MPITRYPFLAMAPGQPRRPVLPIRLTNPATGLSFPTWGFIDTGADDCAIPASYANILGHNLTAGVVKQIGTGNGIANAYAHTTRIEIFKIDGNQFDLDTVVHKIQDAPIDFMPNLDVILLGVNSFLSKFILHVNYPAKQFSIKDPQAWHAEKHTL